MVGDYHFMSGSRTKQYLETNRPWLSLYGTRIRPVHPIGSTSSQPVYEPSLLHRVLPDEILHEIFLRMTANTLGRAACVCRKWLFATRNPSLWRSACYKAWQISGIRENERVVQQSYGGSWRRMWVQRPRLRFDGLYVSRNTYIRAGIAEWRITNPVHLVCYYRYLRFFPSGKLLYKTSPLRVKEVARVMCGRPSRGDTVYSGQFTLTSNQVEAVVVYPGLKPTMLRLRLRLRGTVPGANNRLDVSLLMTTGVGEEEDEENVMDFIDAWQDDETHNPDVPAISHGRGLASFVFVPFDEVETTILNLPVEKMDYYVPG